MNTKFTVGLKRILAFAVLIVLLPVCTAARPPVSDMEKGVPAADLQKAVEKAKSEFESLTKELRARERSLAEDLRQEKIYGTRMDSVRNLLIVPGIKINALEKSVEEIRVSISLIESRLESLKKERENIETKRAARKESLDFVQERINAVQNDSGAGDEYFNDLVSYRSFLRKQAKVLDDLKGLIEKQINIYQSLSGSFEKLAGTLEKEIRDEKEKIVFQRENRTFEPEAWKAHIKKAFSALNPNALGKYAAERIRLARSHMNAGSIVFLLGAAIAYFLLAKAVSFAKGNRVYLDIRSKRAGHPIFILESAVLPVFFILLAHMAAKTKVYIVFPDLINLLQVFLVVLLVTRVSAHAIRLIVPEQGPLYFEAFYRWRLLFIWGIRGYTLVYLFIYRFISPRSLLLTPVRIVSELLLAAGVFIFWNRYARMEKESGRVSTALINRGSKVVAVAGLLADLAGYAYFASWWYISWGVTLSVVCVGVLLFYSIGDVDRQFKDRFEPETRKSYGISYPFYWLVSNSIYFLIFAFVAVGIAFSWGAGEKFLSGAAGIFSRSFTMGKITLSLSGFVYAIVVLLAIYVFTLFWKKIMAERILKQSGLSLGVKESITTISVYIIWGAGVLISLSVLGLNTASMALGFGALGVGLGFGLQNIFNNFVSGLILLFERPIQVGDVVEVAGNWGEVKKINVRATLVQTYTHSSLIIPNSEFISAQVTNWSHRDPYIRRDLLVGVAYGSDTALVKDLMLRAAESVNEVHDYPYPPVVQFINFGDSSLDFRLRFWSVIEDFIKAESNLRFEIDRLFRENGVTIPFPQRDLHLKSGFFYQSDSPPGANEGGDGPD
ncbi:MAG: mechanosensitive ion channel [Desulfarculaceae bacterium]|nr:mechanosensitive ion channel [Desulfarculaceae bacterium]